MKYKTKSIICFLLLAVLVCAAALSGCTPAQGDDKRSIVATIFPEYDWVKQILGDRLDDFGLTLLLNSGSDLHNYQPTATDIVTVANCDMFIYIGGESDEWVDDVLAQSKNKDMIVVNLMEELADLVKEEQEIEGMESEDTHDHDHDEDGELDEHIWLSVKNAVAACNVISEKICALDPDNAATYSANTQSYVAQLNALDDAYAQAVADAATTTLLFGDRFPFRYLTDDYGLRYFAAFSSCSAESEASFETIAFLAGKVDELSLKYVFKLKGSDDKIADTIISTSSAQNATILSLDSMQTITSKDVQNGASYLNIMQENLAVLRQALQ